jgi:hypothetical protein
VADRWAPPLFRPHLIRFSVSTGRRLQKKHTRWLLGRLRPVRCPVCRVPTPQVPASDQAGEKARKCQCCHAIFTKGDAREYARKG